MIDQQTRFKREHILQTMETEDFDVLVIGGGVTGAGIALDAASRGLNTALVEMQDFAAGTSSRSTKMIHGGLRYLKNLEFKIVYQTGRERAIVYENGPHVTTPAWLLLPIYKNGTFGKFSSSIGLRVYDILAGVKKSERKSMLTKKETLQAEPKFNPEGLLGAGKFVEYRSDDARLTIEVMKEAARYGASILNYTKVTDFMYQDGKVAGVLTIDQLTGKLGVIRAKKVVNAAGPWVNEVRVRDEAPDKKQLHLTKGVHLVFDQSVFPLEQTIYFDTSDGRMVLAIPRDGKTYIGTTDTDYQGSMTDPQITLEDKEYLLEAIRFVFPTLSITEEQIESGWAGLRPLIQEEGKSASAISRKDEIWVSDSGLLTIAGGKLTGYRKMAETVVDMIAKDWKKHYGLKVPAGRTKKLPISGGHVGGSKGFEAFSKVKVKEGRALGLTEEEARVLVKRYGSNVDELFGVIQNGKADAERAKLPVTIYAQVWYSIQKEFVCTPVDFFWRRTGALLFNIEWVNEWQQPVIDCMAHLLGWSGETKKSMTESLEYTKRLCIGEVRK
ncbi:glycerol-3-phosphate dehydrogenase/oxidase [Sporosarcina sp. PTS2304]|uniref:glycerol-3-phosphate dehydrogenase/oxidase n=1 Tax=Sporosarcina sp. PTS2304 TaxID=2283194 RepID=UPI000E0DD29F|nr:glycerol-3-phosphate dehydrogenase/oxidase [Sporosarcina sp. PTS2304]AXH98254.1 glycerol-3-phosphate dehydrogenase/oxidase [Sporosarcina sp. PTS2304]